MKKNKKLLLSLSVLATPFVAENIVEENVASANTTYNLTQNVKVYTNAQNASKQVNASKSYSKGTYYVYKQHNGMINISKTPGKAGAWINPATNKPVTQSVENKTTVTNVKTNTTKPVQTVQTPQAETNTTRQVPKQEVSTNTYTLNNSVKTYSNAAAAKTQRGAKSTYSSGNYYIFKEYNGMMNITKVRGRVGAWINPSENKVVRAVNTSSTTSQKITEAKQENRNSITSSTTPKTVTETKKIVTQVQDKPEVNKETSTQKTNVKLTPGEIFTLNSRTNVYTNAAAASAKSASSKGYDQGTYYIYKVHNGMINISRTRGRAGAWINPQEVGAVTAKNWSSSQSKKNPLETTVTESYADRELVYYKQDDPRWKNIRYGNWTMGHTSCVPTSLAMAISTITGESVLPTEVAAKAYKTGWFNGKRGLGTFAQGIPPVLNEYGLKYKLVKTKNDLKYELAKGSIVLATVDGEPFVSRGYSHAMILKGTDGQKTTVFNPLSKRGIQDYTIDKVWQHKSKLAANISLGAAMYVITK